MWTTVSLSETNTGPGNSVAFDALGGFTLTEKHNLSGFIRAQVYFKYAGSSINLDSFGAFGLIVVEDDAMAVPQVPDPFTDGDAPWMLHQYFHWAEPTVIFRELTPFTRSRRRVAIKETVSFVLDVAPASDTSLNWNIYIRLLLQRGR